jgi:hypothetical protein
MDKVQLSKGNANTAMKTIPMILIDHSSTAGVNSAHGAIASRPRQLTRKRCIRRIPTRPRASAIKGPTKNDKLTGPTAPPTGAP